MTIPTRSILIVLVAAYAITFSAFAEEQNAETAQMRGVGYWQSAHPIIKDNIEQVFLHDDPNNLPFLINDPDYALFADGTFYAFRRLECG